MKSTVALALFLALLASPAALVAANNKGSKGPPG
jgi:hypothetical protein